jgi:probable F420-dependent oxidoreductase
MKSYLAAMAEATIDSPRPEEPAPLYIAAHGPKLQKLGANHTDGIITYLMPPVHTQASREHIGENSRLSVVSPFLLESDPVVARAKARKALQYYMTLDYYHREWSQLGFDENDFVDGGSDRLVDTLVGWGTEEALKERLNAYYSAGADRVIAMPFDTVSADGQDSLSVLSPLAN